MEGIHPGWYKFTLLTTLTHGLWRSSDGTKGKWGWLSSSLWSCLTCLKSGRRRVQHVCATFWHGRHVHHIALTTAQSMKLTAGRLARTRQHRAIVAHGYGLVGVGAEHSRPMYCGSVGGAGVVHGNWWNRCQLCKWQSTLKHVKVVWLYFRQLVGGTDGVTWDSSWPIFCSSWRKT